VLLAIGAHKPKPMRVEHEDSEGVIGGVDFLREVVLGNITDVGKKVAVIGGGDTAMDCARVSRRLGADVTLLYRRTQAEMPALPIEQEETIEEGVDIRFLTAPTKVVLDDNGRAKGMEVITMELGEPDESGRRRPVPIEGSEEVLEFDTIIPAIGQDPDMGCIENEANKPETTRWNTFVYDEKTQVTDQEGVFAAGDCAFGPDILIRAIGEGRRAALAIDLYMNGAEVKLTKPYAISRGRLADLEMADFAPRYVHAKRAHESTHSSEKRLADPWASINIGLERATAMAEATRCIECGCQARFDCDLRQYSSDYGASEILFAGENRKYEVDNRHPLIRIEADKCITCASCVRICSEVRGVHALTFIQRGFVTKIGPNFEDPLQDTGCDACGMCTDVCPTAAITLNTGKECGPWIWQSERTSCTACDRGCGLDVHTAEGKVVKIQSVDGDPVNGAVICAEGRFSYQLQAKGADAQGDIAAAKGALEGAGSAAVVVSPRLTVEQTFAAAKLAASANASLNYLAGEAGEADGNRKISGEANLALLNKLGATPLSGSVDCIVSVGAGVTKEQAGSAALIALATPGTAAEADHALAMADPLNISGTVLNRDGKLALLNGSLQDEADPAGLATLAALAGDDSLADLAAVRKALASEVTELSALNSLNGARLVDAGLAPELGGVAPDAREQAFQAHLSSLGL
jgi:formate dehydrogenase major subunit